MAHELQFQDGRASMFSVRETPWHREGVVLTEAPTYEDAIALAHLDYPVEKRPYLIPASNGTDTVASEVGFYTYRPDTGKELGAVGRVYEPVQNVDAFRVLKPLIDEGIGTLETGGVLREGADAWLMIRWNLARFSPIVREIFADELVPFGLMGMNHSGRRGNLLKDVQERVVCANTLGMAEGEGGKAVVVPHTTDATIKLVEAAHEMWGGIIERYERLAKSYKALKETILTEEQFKAAILDVIAPDPRLSPKFNPEAKLAEVVLGRVERKRTELRRVWEEGKGHTGDHSAWEGYNAAAEVIDHNNELFPIRAGSWRTASLMSGHLGALKSQVYQNVLALSA